MKVFIRKTDLLIIVILLGAALIMTITRSFIFAEKGQKAEIYFDGELIETVSLEKNTTFQLHDVPAIVFRVENGAVCFLSSDCPDKICINSGWLRYTGQQAVCLPNKVILQIPGNSQIDAITK